MQEAEDNENLLLEYSKERDPPQKKFKVDGGDIDAAMQTESDDMEYSSPPPKAIASSRNPFKKGSAVSDILQSPTRITSANSSLIKNQSPVKAIDFRRLTKLSKFNRTESPTKRNVISRFFTEPQDNSIIPNGNDLKVEKHPTAIQNAIEEKIDYIDMEETKVASVATVLYSNVSGDSAVSLGVEMSASQSIQGTVSDGEVIDEFKQKTDISSDSNDEIIMLSETDEKSEEGASSQPKIEPKIAQLRIDSVSTSIRSELHNMDSKIMFHSFQEKNGRRKPGLSLKNSKKRTLNKVQSTESTSVQSKLSMFGFQKR